MELADSYLYCPVCGTKRSNFSPSRPFHCQNCGHTSFFGPVSAVGAIVTDAMNRILLIRRAKEPGLGKLGMPGGFVDQGETAEEALRREVHEEVGLAIGNLTYIMSAPNNYFYRGVNIPVLDIFFHVSIDSEQTIAAQDSEVSEWLWTELTDAVLDQMAFTSNRVALERYRNSIIS